MLYLQIFIAGNEWKILLQNQSRVKSVVLVGGERKNGQTASYARKIDISGIISHSVAYGASFFFFEILSFLTLVF